MPGRGDAAVNVGDGTIIDVSDDAQMEAVDVAILLAAGAFALHRTQMQARNVHRDARFCEQATDLAAQRPA
jgi:hypothetical protein